MPLEPGYRHRLLMEAALLALAVGGAGAGAQQVKRVEEIPPVTISAKANPNPVEKSYRKMIRGMDLFEQQRGMSPNAPLRFKLLPRKRETDMNHITLAVVGDTVDFLVPVAADHTFTLPHDPLALDEDAQVIPNRKAQSMTWRTEIRTPGLPAGTRRLGDLRLECRVGMEAGLVPTAAPCLAGSPARSWTHRPIATKRHPCTSSLLIGPCSA
jgi:hypothetical protein